MPSWSARHFSLSNPRDDRPTDLPHLLCRVANLIEHAGITPMQMLDLNVHHEMTEDGPWWRVTAYWSPDIADE